MRLSSSVISGAPVASWRARFGVEHQRAEQVFDAVDAEARVVQRRIAQRQAGLGQALLHGQRQVAGQEHHGVGIGTVDAHVRDRR